MPCNHDSRTSSRFLFLARSARRIPQGGLDQVGNDVARTGLEIRCKSSYARQLYAIAEAVFSRRGGSSVTGRTFDIWAYSTVVALQRNGVIRAVGKMRRKLWIW